MQTFGEMLITARTAAGISTTAELARRLAQAGCEVSEAAVGHWERGVRRPRREHMRVLAEVVGWGPVERARAEDILAAPAAPSEAA